MDSLNSSSTDQRLIRTASQTAEPSLGEVWYIPDDAVYDQL